MMNIDLNKRLKQIDNVELLGDNDLQSRLLAKILTETNPVGVDPVRAYRLARELWISDRLLCEEKELEALMGAVRNSQILNLLKAQLLISIEENLPTYPMGER